uniref:abnormal spindle-like microcephaly-associated protein homolog n=1 Tax=Fragaria vesca subsp. vesca TaxID=101020 RepID=UPI0005C971AF|nr:PREDICTED: abnormal spindle-like microcephaly-associated protein homolog [Fragaria vesca subsp. vesca]
MDAAEPPPSPSPSPSRYKPPSTLFKDISNFKTPKRPSRISEFHSPCPQFFTAAKQTPRTNSSFRRRPPPSSARTNAVRKLKAVELEQSQSSRKVQIRKEQSLKSLEKSLTVWLNFLFENPRSCGCNFPVDEDHGQTLRKGKRDSGSGVQVRVDAAWRDPKRQRDSSWRGEDSEGAVAFSISKYSKLQSSLKLLCSFDDLILRMRFHLSLGSCQEVFDSMIQVVKNIDEGRLKMKVHCPLVTDVGLRKKATKVLLSYNPIWLRIGLYIIFGGDSLLSDRDVNSDEEVAFLKMIIEKQLFAHAGLAKEYAYNKKVEGLYRPGYYEALGNVILKRFLLLVIILDRAKSQSCLSLKYGLDGVDGGSPLLFTVQSSIKSSQQVIHDFLSSDIMLGEGNVSAHLVILGYKVSHQQSPIVDFDFRVTDLFADLQDGLHLCRAIQLLQDDSSILMKMVVPSDTHKKHLSNCGTALQYLKEAGVVLHDDGLMIVEDDIANGDKELTISLLWNMFVHLQLPLLVKKTTLADEICKIRGTMDSFMDVDSAPLEMLLSWIQAICEIYDCKIDSFSSLVDGKAVWCLLDYHFRKQLCCAWSSKDPNKSSQEESIMLASEYSDAVHNFLLSQKLMSLLGNFPEVLQISDILEYNGVPNDRSVVILLAFLSSQLIGKKNMDQINFHKLLGCDCQSSERICSVRPEPTQIQEETYVQHTEGSVRNFKAIQAWWQDMAEKNRKLPKPSAPTLQNFSTNKDEINISRVNAAKRIRSVLLIQQAVRNWMMRRRQDRSMLTHDAHRHQDRSMLTHDAHIHDLVNAAIVVQRYTRGWLARSRCIHGGPLIHKSLSMFQENGAKRIPSVLLIQQAARNWIMRRHQDRSMITHDARIHDQVNAAIVVQRYTRGWLGRSRCNLGGPLIHKSSSMFQENGALDVRTWAAVKIQLAWNYYVCHTLHKKHFAAIKIQSHFCSWLLRRRFHIQRQATIKVQSALRMLKCWKAYQQYKVATKSATTIQSYVRGWAARREANIRRHLIVTIQRYCHGWLRRRHFLHQRKAVVKIQSTIRCLLYRQAFQCLRHAAVEIQRIVRGEICRSNLLGSSCLHPVIPHGCLSKTTSAFYSSFELNIVFCSVLKLQRWWRSVLSLKLRTKSAVLIQSRIREWLARQKASREKHCSVVIQSHWRGYQARKKESREQLKDIRLRVQKSSTSVDDSMRIINRLVAALSELLRMKSLSNILHTCATLDMATRYSQKCCERLVDAGAIKTLLKLIHSGSRSIPDQEVLKHALSTLRNLARYPHLVEVLTDCEGSVETILWELLRNKEEGYFIASELLKKICSSPKGAEAVRKSPAHLKRLRSLVEELSRKSCNEKRNARLANARENTERRLKEATVILKMATEN